jgi:hypothetical protein
MLTLAFGFFFFFLFLLTTLSFVSSCNTSNGRSKAASVPRAAASGKMGASTFISAAISAMFADYSSSELDL